MNLTEEEKRHYEELEREHLGDSDLGTGIYHPDSLNSAKELTEGRAVQLIRPDIPKE